MATTTRPLVGWRSLQTQLALTTQLRVRERSRTTQSASITQLPVLGLLGATQVSIHLPTTTPQLAMKRSLRTQACFFLVNVGEARTQRSALRRSLTNYLAVKTRPSVLKRCLAATVPPLKTRLAALKPPLATQPASLTWHEARVLATDSPPAIPILILVTRVRLARIA